MDIIEIILGTYEEFVLGYEVKFENKVCQLKQTIANHNHSSSVRCVASNGNLLVSGGADNNIFVYDLETRKECGLLPQPATVSCAAFTPDQSHIVVGGGDGCLSFFKVGNFVLEKKWGSAHNNLGIVSVSIHPSGKIALTVGNDGVLKTWNLVKGRLAYAKALARKKKFEGYQISGVLWSPSGEFYAVGIGTKVDIYCVETAGIVYTASPSVKICCFQFVNDSLLAIGCENGSIVMVDISKKEKLTEIVQAHDLRVKCLSCFATGDVTYLVSASSNGEVKVWKVENLELKELAKVNTKCRITCLTIMKHTVKVEEEDDEKCASGIASNSASNCDSSDSESQSDSSDSESSDSKSDSDLGNSKQGKKHKWNSSEDLESSDVGSEKKKRKKRKPSHVS